MIKSYSLKSVNYLRRTNMPNIKSAKKRVIVSDKKRMQNKMVLSEMKTAVKKFNAAISANDVNEAERLLPLTSHAIDNAAVKGVIHKNKANHAKAQIGNALNLLKKGVIVVKADAKTLKQAEQKAAAQKRAAEEAAAKQARKEARAQKEAAKAPAPAKKATKKAADGEAKPAAKKTTKKVADGEEKPAKKTTKKAEPKAE